MPVVDRSGLERPRLIQTDVCTLSLEIQGHMSWCTPAYDSKHRSTLLVRVVLAPAKFELGATLYTYLQRLLWSITKLLRN